MSQSYFKLRRLLPVHEHLQWCQQAVVRGLRTPRRRSSPARQL
nr:MAG TPA: hypothetical protein [Caudoviricetes sp.]